MQLRVPATWSVVVALVLLPATAWAQERALRLTDQLTGQLLGEWVGVHEDPAGEQTLAMLLQEGPSAFRASKKPTVGFGFTRSTAWLRLRVENPTDAPRTWLLELGFPPIDHVTLFEPTDDGYRERTSGDRLPFVRRDIPFRNVVYQVTQPPGNATYYLRVRTEGSLQIPLRAWTPAAFMNRLAEEQPLLWLCYGTLAAMCLYNLFIFISMRSRDYLYYVLFLLSYSAFQLTLNGLAFQYLWPQQVWWANQCLPAFNSLSYFTGFQFMRYFLGTPQQLPRLDLALRFVGVYSALLVAPVTLVIPYEYAIRISVIQGMAGLCVAAPAVVILVMRRRRQAFFFVAAWGMFLGGVFTYLLKTLNVLPSNLWTEWGILVGGTLQVILLSLGLADRINVMRKNVDSLNRKLENNVDELRDALGRAEAARRAKSEFLAGVSHELRTPLNTIINLPEAMLEEFEDTGSVTCTHCRSVFELEPGDALDATTPCPECQQPGLEDTGTFRGNLTQGRKRLRHVVRSGRHLLEVINDILDVSRLEAGRMTVEMRTIELCDHLRQKLSPLQGLAEVQGVKLELQLPDTPVLVKGDPTKLAQVAINLVSNAIKFSDGSGTVTVTLRAESTFCVLSVADEGVGIAPADQARIFESFVQAQGGGTRRFGGSGLGLSISKQFVEMHGGSITVTSELHQGSTFSVRLPLAEAEAEDANWAAHEQPRSVDTANGALR